MLKDMLLTKFTNMEQVILGIGYLFVFGYLCID